VDSRDENRLPLPHWHLLRDLVLLTLAGERDPVRRYELAERTIAAGRWSRELRQQRPLATSPTHSTHLAERADATIGQMHREGLLERPSRGRYKLSRDGQRRARALSDMSLTKGAPARAVAQSPRPRAGLSKPTPDLLPRWAMGMSVGRWRPFTPLAPVAKRAPAPFTWDTDAKDAETQEHADVLNRLYRLLQSAEVSVVCGTTRPACDLAFKTRAGITIVEAKSLPNGSDDHQMRVGLGQVLEYRAELSNHVDRPIHAIVAVPRAPDRAATWRSACDGAGVTLLVVGPATRGLRRALNV
jgi:hypothetical protein